MNEDAKFIPPPIPLPGGGRVLITEMPKEFLEYMSKRQPLIDWMLSLDEPPTTLRKEVETYFKNRRKQRLKEMEHKPIEELTLGEIQLIKAELADKIKEVIDAFPYKNHLSSVSVLSQLKALSLLKAYDFEQAYNHRYDIKISFDFEQ